MHESKISDQQMVTSGAARRKKWRLVVSFDGLRVRVGKIEKSFANPYPGDLTMFTTRKMRKSRTSLRGFEGLETRELLAADLFAANSTAPVEELSPADAPAGYYVESSGSADEGLPGTVEDPVYTGDAVVDDNWAVGSGHEYGHDDTALALMAMNAMDETAWHNKEALDRMRSAVKDLSHAAFNNSVAVAHERIEAEKDSAQLAMTMAWVNIALLFVGLDIIVRYFEFSWGLLDRSLVFVAAGLILLLVGFLVEKGRRTMLDRIRASGGPA